MKDPKDMDPMEFAVTLGFDALRLATFGTPKYFDVETICRWLRHVSDQTGKGANPAHRGKPVL